VKPAPRLLCAQAQVVVELAAAKTPVFVAGGQFQFKRTRDARTPLRLLDKDKLRPDHGVVDPVFVILAQSGEFKREFLPLGQAIDQFGKRQQSLRITGLAFLIPCAHIPLERLLVRRWNISRHQWRHGEAMGRDSHDTAEREKREPHFAP
jgi:hypothetical protein